MSTSLREMAIVVEVAKYLRELVNGKLEESGGRGPNCQNAQSDAANKI